MSDNKEINQNNLVEEDSDTKAMVDVDPNAVEACRNVQPSPGTAFLTEVAKIKESRDVETQGLVELDTTQIIAFESHLRNSLVAGTAMILSENSIKVKTTSPNNVKTDAANVAKLSNKLRQHLVELGVMSKEDNEKLRERTGLNKLVDRND
jgi:hypothetical protein